MNSEELLSRVVNSMSDKRLLDHDAKQAQIESLKVLKEIEMNTAYLRDIVDLLNINNENQLEIRELVHGIFDIASSENRKQADDRYRKVMRKIADLSTITTATINVVKLTNMANTVWQLFNKD